MAGRFPVDRPAQPSMGSSQFSPEGVSLRQPHPKHNRKQNYTATAIGHLHVDLAFPESAINSCAPEQGEPRTNGYRKQGWHSQEQALIRAPRLPSSKGQPSGSELSYHRGLRLNASSVDRVRNSAKSITVACKCVFNTCSWN
jgi:hypothetical protein